MKEQSSPLDVRRSLRGIPARWALAIAGTIALILGIALYRPLERAIVLSNVRRATGLQLDAADVERIDGGYALIDLVANTPGGGVNLSAPRVEFVSRDHDARVVLESPHVAIDFERSRGFAMRTLATTLARSVGALTLTVRAGTAALVAGQVPQPVFTFDGIDGSFAMRAASVTGHATAQFEDGSNRYPVTFASSTDAAGIVTKSFEAPELPIAALGAALPTVAGARLQSGSLRDVSVRDGTSLQATMTVDAADVTLGTQTLTGLSGPLVFAGNGVGSKGLTGTIEGTELHVSGEVHDLGPHFQFLANGSNDLADLIDLTERLASEPALTSLSVEAEAPGLEYGQYGLKTDHGPLAVSVLAIDPRERTLRFDTAIAEDHIVSGGERTSAMGLRTGAVAGINGDYFDIGRTYQPQGLLVRAGRLIRGPVNRAALAIDRDKHVRFGEFALVGAATIAGKIYSITQVNDWPVGKITVITPEFGASLPPAPGTHFARLAPLGPPGRYRITSVEACTQALPVSFGLAFGPDVAVIPKQGEHVRLEYDTDPSTRHVVAAIGGGPILVRDGQAFEDRDAPAPDERDYRWPVDALAETDSGRLMLVAVDGRHPERSVGMMRPEFAQLLLRLGARNAMALDSGGSVTLVSRAVGDASVSVRNVPSDNSAERWISDALFLYSSAPAASIVPVTTAPTPVPESRPSP